MTKVEFLNYLQGVIQIDNIPRKYLSVIYNFIEQSAIVLNHDEYGEANRFSLASRITAMITNVKSMDAFVCGLSIHEYCFTTSDNLGPLKPGSPAVKALSQCVVLVWHQYYGLIIAALEIAHLDLQGMDSCIYILK